MGKHRRPAGSRGACGLAETTGAVGLEAWRRWCEAEKSLEAIGRGSWLKEQAADPEAWRRCGEEEKGALVADQGGCDRTYPPPPRDSS